MTCQVILVDCSEISPDEKLALASSISDDLEGIAIALVKGEDIVLDDFASNLDISKVKQVITDFASRRDAKYYSVESFGERIILHCSAPAVKRGRVQNQLPPNLKQCAYCAVVTQYEEEFTVHVRSHLVGVDV